MSRYIDSRCLVPKEKAKILQESLAEDFDLSYWYGTNCKKCCCVFPKLGLSLGFDSKCFYYCEVCGRSTELFSMPFMAEEAWNNDNVNSDFQMCFKQLYLDGLD